MTTTIDQKQQQIRDLFSGRSTAPLFMCQPPLVPLHQVGDYTLSSEPVSNWVPWVVENYRHSAAAAERHQDDSVPVARLSTGTQLFANAFGCDVHIPPGDNPAAVPLVANATEADLLEIPDIWQTRCLARVFELGETVRRELGPDVPLGVCDMQTGFDIAAMIWEKSDLMCAMALEPEAVMRLSEKCARLLKTFLIELRRAFPDMSPCHCPGHWSPPELGPWVSSDEIGAISPAMFEAFCLPELQSLSETFGSIALHCCADAEHQFAGLAKIDNFYAFNRVQAKHGYLPLLDHFAGPTGPVHSLAWLPDDAIEQLLTRAPSGTRFIFVKMGADSDTADRWLERGRSLAAQRDA